MNRRIHGAGLILLAMLGFTPMPALAQTLQSVQVEPAGTKPGEPVTVTLKFELGENPGCGMHVDFGDGRSETAMVSQAKDATIALIHVYEKPGNFLVMAVPKGVGAAIECRGKNTAVMVAVAAPAAAARKTQGRVK